MPPGEHGNMGTAEPTAKAEKEKGKKKKKRLPRVKGKKRIREPRKGSILLVGGGSRREK